MSVSSNSSNTKEPSWGLQPTIAWTAILSFILFSALCILAGAGSILRLTFPLLAFAVGLLLYFRYPLLYAGFTWWLWFLTAWVARVVDYRSGWDPQRIMLVAPFLVTIISGITALKYLPRTYQQGGLPFLLAFGGVFYGFIVGLIQNPVFPVIRALLDWLPPILFGFHLFINWQDYPKYRQNIRTTFLWGILVVGVYGVIQYLIAPQWDRAWITNTELVSFGTPEPLGIRVFSTLNSTGPFASVMMAGLLLLFDSQSSFRFIAAGAGYLSLLLSLARTAWGGWLVAALVHLSSLKSSLQMRMILTVTIMAVVILPLAAIDPFAEIITSRLQTFTNLGSDASLNARTEIYEDGLGLALVQGLGNGLGSITRDEVVDSGIIEFLMTLGWFGTIPYAVGVILILACLFSYSESRFDSFVSIARAIGFSSALQLVIGSSMLGVSGVILWGFIGMGMAAHKYYYRRQLSLASHQPQGLNID